MRSFKRPVAAVLLTAAMLAVLAGEVASAVDFERIEIRLSGAAEVPTNPHGNRDRGKVTIFVPEDLFETRSETVSICFKFGRLTLTPGEPLPHAGHIHFGPAGEAGPVVLHIFGTGDGAPAPTSYPTGRICRQAPTALVQAMVDDPDLYYVNLHNATHPSGVVRGQLSDDL